MKDECCGPDERQFSYAQVEYVPPFAVAGRLRSVALLRALAAEFAMSDHLEELIESTRREFGLNRTVWGVKFVDDRVGIEFYYYNHSDDRPLTLSRVGRAIGVDIPSFGRSASELLWSVSIDLDVVDATVVPGDVHLYFVHDSVPPTCVSYRLSAPPVLENVYYLFRGEGSPAETRHWLKGSAHVGAAFADDLVLDEMMPCDHVAVAHKPGGDGIYYGGVTASQVGWFARRFGMPGAAVSCIENLSESLGHLLWDVGADLTTLDGGVLTSKTALYGTV